jgi:hypothetical protein
MAEAYHAFLLKIYYVKDIIRKRVLDTYSVEWQTVKAERSGIII